MIHSILIQTEVETEPDQDSREDITFIFSQKFNNPKTLAVTIEQAVRSKFGDGFTEQFLFQLTKQIVKNSKK